MNDLNLNIAEGKKQLMDLLGHNYVAEAAGLCAEMRKYRPQDAELLIIEGCINSRLGEPQSARESFNRALSIQNNNAAAYYYLGLLDEHEGRLDAAQDNYKKSLELAPTDPTGRVFLQLATLTKRQGKLDEALYYIGCDFGVRNMPNDAALHFRMALDINPQFTEAYIGLGNALRNQDKFEDAIDSFQKAINCNPSLAKAHRGLGIALGGVRQFSDALQSFDQALTFAPHDAETHYWRAIVLLTFGNLAEGWDEYEWRMRWDAIAGLVGSRRNFRLPLWQGEHVSDKTILVYGEQGIGDEIMFASCFKDILAITGHTVIECDDRLIAIMRRSFPEARVVGRFRDGDDGWLARLPPVDYRVSAGSLPRFFRRSFDNFPEKNSYLAPNLAQVEQWRGKYEQLGSGLKVGISWTGGKTPQERQKRSAPLEQWSNLFAVPDVHFINLQYGEYNNELKRVKESQGINIHDLPGSSPLVDFDDFAAKIAALDLVISIDNSTVHIAGALGISTWTLLPYVADWRWMLDRMDSPWYPTVQLFRQPASGAWAPVFEHVAKKLHASKRLMKK